MTVVNALQSSLVDRVAMDGGHAVAHSHSAKGRKYEARCEAEGMEFLPLGLDTFGGWHKDVSWLGWWVWMRVTLSNVFDSVLV